MAARDRIHDAVRNALRKDGWFITNDPYVLRYDDLTVLADLGAARISRSGEQDRIVVEIKSFDARSDVREFETAIGQYMIYSVLLKGRMLPHKVFLAVDTKIYEEFFGRSAIQLVVQELKLSIVVVDLNSETVQSWTQS